MTDNTLHVRSQMAQEADEEDPGNPHCARCGSNSPVAILLVSPLAQPENGDQGYSAAICDVCSQRVLDLMVNPHLLVTARTSNPLTQTAEVMVDGASFTRSDAVDVLRHAANMLDNGEPEIITIDGES